MGSGWLLPRCRPALVLSAVLVCALGSACDRPRGAPSASDEDAPASALLRVGDLAFRFDATDAPSWDPRRADLAVAFETGMGTAPGFTASRAGTAISGTASCALIDVAGHGNDVFLDCVAQLRAARDGVLPDPLVVDRIRRMPRRLVLADDGPQRIRFEVLDFGRLLGDAAQLYRASEAAIVDALADPRREMNLVAVREVERRGIVAAVARVEALLDPADDELFLAALDALLRVGTPTSGQAVVERLPSSGPLLAAAVPALARLPGDAVDAYLRAVSEGHPDLAIRGDASRALEARQSAPPTR